MAKKNNLNISDLSTWPMALSVIVALFFAAGIVFAAKNFLVADLTSQVDELDIKIKKQEVEYENGQKIIALLPHVRKEVSQLKLVRDYAKKYLPTKVSMPSLIDNVYLAARENGIVFSDFTPRRDIETDYYTIKPISLTAKVGYLDMAAFIEKVTTLKRIMNVQSVTYNLGKDKKEAQSPNDELHMTAELRTYIFKETIDEGK